MKQKIDLDALEAALAKATPGPWRRGSRDEYVVIHLDHGYIVCDEDPEDDNAERVEADTDTIIAAHNALPALIAELRELRSYRAEVEAIMPTMQMLLDFYDDARAEAAVTIPPARKARP